MRDSCAVNGGAATRAAAVLSIVAAADDIQPPNAARPNPSRAIATRAPSPPTILVNQPRARIKARNLGRTSDQ